jgi:hypothetical protein
MPGGAVEVLGEVCLGDVSDAKDQKGLLAMSAAAAVAPMGQQMAASNGLVQCLAMQFIWARANKGKGNHITDRADTL